MLKLLIDASVWLDLAKDYRKLPLLALLGDLVERDEVELLVPEVVREEFARNRAHVLAAARLARENTSTDRNVSRVSSVAIRASKKRAAGAPWLSRYDGRRPPG